MYLPGHAHWQFLAELIEAAAADVQSSESGPVVCIVASCRQQQNITVPHQRAKVGYKSLFCRSIDGPQKLNNLVTDSQTIRLPQSETHSVLPSAFMLIFPCCAHARIIRRTHQRTVRAQKDTSLVLSFTDINGRIKRSKFQHIPFFNELSCCVAFIQSTCRRFVKQTNLSAHPSKCFVRP